MKEFDLVNPCASDLLEWFKYDRHDLYEQMLNGKEIGFQS